MYTCIYIIHVYIYVYIYVCIHMCGCVHVYYNACVCHYNACVCHYNTSLLHHAKSHDFKKKFVKWHGKKKEKLRMGHGDSSYLDHACLIHTCVCHYNTCVCHYNESLQSASYYRAKSHVSKN